MDPVDFPRRLRAARALADVTVEQLAAKLDLPGMGAATIGAIERGEREVRRHEIPALAEALDIPDDFFTGPLLFAADDKRATAGLDSVAARQQEILEKLEAWDKTIMDVQRESIERLIERLDNIDRRLALVDEVKQAEGATDEGRGQVSRGSRRRLRS